MCLYIHLWDIAVQLSVQLLHHIIAFALHVRFDLTAYSLQGCFK